MPIQVVQLSELPSPSRRSKITSLKEWVEIKDALATGLPRGAALQVTFSPESVRQYKDDVGKCAFAFVLRLRKEYSSKYRIQLIHKTDIRIVNRDANVS